jgi:hypothetical protein
MEKKIYLIKAKMENKTIQNSGFFPETVVNQDFLFNGFGAIL